MKLAPACSNRVSYVFKVEDGGGSILCCQSTVSKDVEG